MFCSSTFGEILKLLPRDLVAAAARENGSDRWRKRFMSWDHLVVMLSAQLSGAASLRDVETVFNGQAAQHYHLRCGPVRRSTLADANRGRDYGFFGAVASGLMAASGRRSRALKGLLAVMDASVITLRGRGLDWAGASRTRDGNQGLKLHVCLTPQSGLVDYVSLSSSSASDLSAAYDVSLEAGRIYVFDKGYCNYDWWRKIADSGADFVTRLKRNAAYRVVEERPVAADRDGLIRRDAVIVLSNAKPRGGKLNQLAGRRLRLIEIRHPGGKKRPFVLVSTLLEASAETIAGYYKERWKIELFFKWIKQNLKIKRFLGESRNAIMIQIYVAIIAYILVMMYHRLNAIPYAKRLKDLIVWIRANLFARPDRDHRRRRKRHIGQARQPDLWAKT